MHASFGSVPWLIVVGLGVVAASRAVIPTGAPVTQPPTFELQGAVDEPAEHVVLQVRERAAATQLSFVLEIDGTPYVQIAELDDARPRHGKTKFVTAPGQHPTDHEFAALARVGERALPAQYRGWIGRRVVVDEKCEANVTGFAVIARLEGFHAGLANGRYDEHEDQEATAFEQEQRSRAKTVLENGHVILAAELDGCTGTVARNAADKPLVMFEEQHDEVLEVAARRALIESTDINTGLIHHPITGATFVWATGWLDDREAPDLNLFGLWRVDANGKLDEVVTREICSDRPQLLDIEGDGKLEMVVRQCWDGDLVLDAVHGDE